MIIVGGLDRWERNSQNQEGGTKNGENRGH